MSRVRALVRPVLIGIACLGAAAAVGWGAYDHFTSAGVSGGLSGAAAIARKNIAAHGGRIININTAGSAELQQLSGIGPATAKAIIQHRETHGPFVNIRDITQVKGIGLKIFGQIKDVITVED